MIAIYFKGFVIGLSIAAPVGPIGILCLQRSLAHGRGSGLATGLGAACADAVYGMCAALGLAALGDFFAAAGPWLRLFGGLFLLYLGASALRAQPPRFEGDAAKPHHAGAFASTFFLTLTNPMTILSFAGIFAGLGIAAGGEGFLPGAALVAGVFCGSAAWWLFLSGMAGAFRSRLYPRLRLINACSGLILCVFGLVAAGSFFMRFS